MRAVIIVSGLVQGVGYRYFIYRHAVQLGLVGYTKNLIDGSVEIVVEGEKGSINALIQEAKVGPRSAHVKDLKISWEDSTNEFHEFKITGW
ncbi:MAG: acylphosphatase [Ignavibacteria bacterium]|nr:acylphosphatase [Ignavibacteria bacterium]